MSLWLPQGTRHVQRVGVLHTTRRANYSRHALSQIATHRRITKHTNIPYSYHSLIIDYLQPRPETSFGCRTYATSTPPNESPSSSANVESPPSSSNTPAEVVQPWKTRMWAKVKHEAAHYWHGSKLLVSEMRISLRLVFALLKGKTLTRREKRQVRLFFSFRVF
jgi:LETM1 and EF-hand domain-containing protein 1